MPQAYRAFQGTRDRIVDSVMRLLNYTDRAMRCRHELKCVRHEEVGPARVRLSWPRRN
jgi:hypothetical protein